MSRNLTAEELEKLFGQKDDKPAVVKVRFKPLEEVSDLKPTQRPVEQLGDVKLSIMAQLGQTKLTVKEVLELKEGDVIQLDRLAGEAVDLYLNHQPFATGEIVIINDIFGIRIGNLIDAEGEGEQEE